MDASKSFYCAAGFRDDATEFISQFVLSESHMYDDFVLVWKEMKFFRVFIGRSTRSELMEFCEEALDITKELLLSFKDFIEKIGGLFLLYSIYFSMPLRGPKIRIIMSEWENLIAFKKSLIDQKRWDCIMVLNKLVDGNAFAYCLCDNERGLENYYVLKDFMKGNSRPIESQKKKVKLQSIFDNVVKEASNYSKLKDKLSYKLGINANKVPMLFTDDALKEIAETVKNLDELVKEKANNSENSRRSKRAFCPPVSKNGDEDKNEREDSEPDYHQDSDSNDDDPDYRARTPESLGAFDADRDVNVNVGGNENKNQAPMVKITKIDESQMKKFCEASGYQDFCDKQIPSTSKSDGVNNDFDYLPHIKMEKTHYDSDYSDEDFPLLDY
ncbi:proximal sequence element A Pbp45 [Cotesia typhae]|uniref:proximal sequence element A Pbp45 n=1 Tax=Cotesia typhae TaxID=2053667 RepID=UPI003D68E16E